MYRRRQWGFFLIIFSGVAISLVLGVVFYLLSLGNGYHNQSLAEDFQPAVEINRNIKLIHSDGTVERIHLPQKVKTEESFVIELDLSEYGTTDGKSLAFMASYIEFECFVDGKPIYRYQVGEDRFLKSGGYSLHMIDLPREMNSDKVRFKCYKRFDNLNLCTIIPIPYGKRLNIVLTQLYKKELIRVVIIFCLLVIFLITCLLSLYHWIKKRTENELFYIGLLCFMIGIYFSTQLWTLRYLLYRNSIILVFIEYTALILLPVPALGLTRGRLDPRFDWLNDVTIAGLLLNFIIQFVIVLLKIAEFREMLPITHAFLGVSIIISLGLILLTDGKKYPAKREILISLMPLWVNLSLAIVSFLIFNRIVQIDLLLFVVVLFVGIQIARVMNTYTTIENEKLKSKIYLEMAVVDSMTGLKNRSGYSHYLEQQKESKIDFWIISLDLNNLKQVNDQYGHKYGDELIVKFAQCLKRQAAEVQCDKIFRLGGDEFMMFAEKGREFEVNGFINRIRQAAEQIKIGDQEQGISFSAGYYYYSSNQEISLEEAIYQSDKNMYHDKRTFKQAGTER